MRKTANEMLHPTHRYAFAAAVGLGVLGMASQANAAYVCQIELFVWEEATGSGSVSQPMSFEVRLHDQPYCGGTQVGQPMRVRNQQFPVLVTSKVYDTVLTNAKAEYEDTSVLGAFLQLHSAAALGIPVEAQSTGEPSITLRYEGVSISQVHDGPPSPATGSDASTFEGYVCRTRTQVQGSHGMTYAAGHELQLALSAYPDCKGPTTHQRTLSPRTQSALPDPKKSGASATLSYEQARRQEFNLATVALGHAMMMAEAGKMLVQVNENPSTHALSSVRFRAIPHSTCPITKPTPKTPPKPKPPAPKPTFQPPTKQALPGDGDRRTTKRKRSRSRK